jgi:3-oxoacyl-(acyl-carrier-protein) synthase
MSSSVEVSTWAPRPGEDVCICAIGARTPVGFTAAASAAAVRAGISRLGLHPSFVDQDDEPVSFAADPATAPDIPIAARMQDMLNSVADEVQGQLPVAMSIDGCWLALPEPRAGLPTDLAPWLADSTQGPVHVLSRGHAGGLMALQAAAQALSHDEVEIALVIGVDSYHDLVTIQSLDMRRRLMAARNPGGFPPGEAAGACLLVRGETAARRGIPVLARIRSAATAVEPHPLRSDDPCLGEALTAVVASAASGLQRPQELITATYCDLNGERYRSEEFLYTLLRTGAAFVKAHDYVSPADCWGDVGAASGPLFAVLAVASGLGGYAKGAYPLLWAGSDSGYRAAVLLELGHS